MTKSKQNRIEAPEPASFYFSEQDKEILKYGAAKSGLTQSELMRRLIRIYAAGTALPGLAPIPPHTEAAKWLDLVVVSVKKTK